jgi:MFS family permease
MSSNALAPLKNRDFRFLLSGFAIGQMLMPLQFITQILWVQQFAPRDIWLILVAAIAASRGLGALTFSMYGGALADRFDRRKLLLVILSIQVACTLCIAALMYIATDQFLGYAAFFALTFLSSGLQSIDGPTRLAIVPDVLGAADTPAGMSLNQIAAQIAMPVAMAFTGILITGFGYSGAYHWLYIPHALRTRCLPATAKWQTLWGTRGILRYWCGITLGCQSQRDRLANHTGDTDAEFWLPGHRQLRPNMGNNSH